MSDAYRFLDPWTLLLPEGGGAVVAAAGSGGKTALLNRLLDHYRLAGASVLWTQTVDHPEPAAAEARNPPIVAMSASATGELRDALDRDGAVFAAVEPSARGESWGGVSPRRVVELRDLLRPDVVLVEAHERTGTPLRADGRLAAWPDGLGLGFVVAQSSAVGRIYGPGVVAGVSEPHREPGIEPRRVEVSELLGMVLELLDGVPESALPVPFFTGFGAFRDMDGMFRIVSELWERPRVKAVCLAELLGDERRDLADRQSVGGHPAGASQLSGERVYALYPADLDGE